MCSMFLPDSIQEALPEYSFTQSYTVLAPADRLQAPQEVHALGPAEEGRGFVSCRHGAMRGMRRSWSVKWPDLSINLTL